MSNTTPLSILVADFGEAFITHGTTSNKAGGTRHYMAPERGSNLLTKKSDLWSCGVIIYQMIHLKLPFRDLNEIYNKELPEFDGTPISNDLKPLLVEYRYF